MRYRPLGLSGPPVSAIGFGCYGMTGGYGPADENEALRTLQIALDSGVNLIDTSDAYGAGRNEALLGRALKGRRDNAVVVTKFGNPGFDAEGRPMDVCGAPDYVPTACERSLRRLGVETIDLYLLHRVDPKVPIEETVGAMAGLVRAGKVRRIGLSEAAPTTIRRAHAVHPLAAVESEYSLWSRGPETDGHLATCRERGISFLAYSPLGRGFLTGAVRDRSFGAGDVRASMPRFSEANLPHNLGALARFNALAAELGVTSGQLALAWLLAQGEDILPIPGTTKPRHLTENIAAAELALSLPVLARIDAALGPNSIAGARYDEGYLQTVDI